MTKPILGYCRLPSQHEKPLSLIGYFLRVLKRPFKIHITSPLTSALNIVLVSLDRVHKPRTFGNSSICSQTYSNVNNWRHDYENFRICQSIN